MSAPTPPLPGLGLITVEDIDSLYYRPPGAIRKKYNGKPYTCIICAQRVSGETPHEHYKRNHQPTSRVRFPDEEKGRELKRSPETNLFHCPRCTATFRSPRHLQDHANAWKKRCPPSSATNLSPAKPQPSRTQPSPSTPSKTPEIRRTRSRQSTAAQPTPAKAVARPLKTPTRTRTGVPKISRTFRAMIRQCYAQRTMSNKEIAEYCNCDVRDVYFAVNNESGDNLAEDQDYLDGKRGDVVNLDDFADDAFASMDQSQVFEADEKLDVDMSTEDVFASTSSSPARSRRAAGPTRSKRTSDRTPRRAEPVLETSPVPSGSLELSYPTPESESPREDEPTYDSEEEVERDYIRVVYSPSPEPESAMDWQASGGTADPATSTSMAMDLAEEHDQSRDPVLAFVCSLGYFTPEAAQHVASVLNKYGVRTGKDLDCLSMFDTEDTEVWDEVEQFFYSKGIEPQGWRAILDGLKVRSETPGGLKARSETR